MRARDLKNKQISEGVLDSAYNVYKTTPLGQRRTAAAATRSAENKFALNLATLIARAIQSGSVIQQAPAQTPAPPTATESRQYQVFDTLLEYLIDEAPGPNPNSTVQIKKGSITNLVNSYVNQLVNQYKWQPNPELSAHSAQLAAQIEQQLSNSQTLQQVLREKGPAMTKMIQQVTQQPTEQLFNTLYQWEQTGQTEQSRQAAQQAQTTTAQQSDDEESSSQQYSSATPAQRRTLKSLGDFLTRASSDPNLLTQPEMKQYKDTLKRLAAGL